MKREVGDTSLAIEFVILGGLTTALVVLLASAVQFVFMLRELSVLRISGREIAELAVAQAAVLEKEHDVITQSAHVTVPPTTRLDQPTPDESWRRESVHRSEEDEEFVDLDLIEPILERE
jgi:hypothetical protein